MNVSELAVRRPVTVAMFVLAVLVFGFISVDRLGIDLLPDLQLPQVTIATVYPAADPQTIEEEVTRPIEDVVSIVSGLQRVESTSMENVSIVTAEFDWGVPLNETMENLRAQLAALSFILPADALEPVVMHLNLAELPVMIVAVSADGDLVDSTDRALAHVRPRLEQVPGVAQVSVLGGAEREIQVLYDNTKLEEHGLTPALLEQVLALQNAIVPGGVLEDNGTRYSTKIGNHFTDVQQIRDLVIGESRLPVQGIAALWPPLLHVKDVAQVVDGLKEPTGYARVDGRPTVFVQVNKRPGANTVTVAEGIHQALDELRSAAPDLGLTVILDQSVQIVHSLRNLATSGLIGAVLAVAVLLLFLRDWRSILIIASAIPLSIIVTIVFLYFTDLNLNLMTLGGLALGTGMLVDNAIIVLENIFRHRRQEGKTPIAAAIDGSKEVGGAVLAATLTTVAVFLPVVFMDSFIGRLFKELGLTVSLSLTASLLVSLTVVPVMARSVLRAGATARRRGVPDGSELPEIPETPAEKAGWTEAAAASEGRPDRLTAGYEHLLRAVLARRGTVLVAIAVFTVATLLLWPRLGIEFLPPMPSRTVYVTIEMPSGTPLSDSDAVAREAEARLAAMPRIDFVAAQVGQQYHGDLLSLMQGQETNVIRLLAYVPDAVQARDLTDLIEQLRTALSDLPARRVWVGHEWESGANVFSSDIILEIRGHDMASLETVAVQLEERLVQAVAGRAEVRVSLADQQPELYFEVNQSRALIGGLTNAQISLAVRNALSGVQATQVRQDGRTVPVIMRPHPDQVQGLDNLLDFRVSSPVPLSLTDTTNIRLANVVEVVERTGPQSIRRIDGVRAVEVRVRPTESDVRTLRNAVEQAVAAIELPPDVTIRQGGLTAVIDEAWNELGGVLLLSLALVYMVMAAQFESWRFPIIVMVTVPLAGAGAIWVLWLTGTNIGVASLIGLILLGGIVVNNGIVLVDYTNVLVRRGVNVVEAVVLGARRRLRPVLMTATTTIGGMIPLALSQEQGLEIQSPLAIAVIGGLTTATVLTLFVVPSLYLLLGSGRDRNAPDGAPPPRPGRHRSNKSINAVLAGLLVVAACLGAGGTPPARAQQAVSGLQFITGIGYSRPDSAPMYLLGAGWRARLADTDWRLQFASATAGLDGQPVIDVGVKGSWFQPISFAGYYELQGDLVARREGDGPFVSAISMSADAVLGNITGHIEYDSIAAGFPQLPWDEPRRVTLTPDGAARRHLLAQLRQQPHRELNVVREFQWARSYDLDDHDGHAIMLAGGAEVRAAGGWLLGKFGVVHYDNRLLPAFAGGFRVRPGPYSLVSIGAASATALSAAPTLTAEYEFIGERTAFNASLQLALDGDERLQPTVFLQSKPHASGFRWQLGVGPLHSTQRAMFGLFTSF